MTSRVSLKFTSGVLAGRRFSLGQGDFMTIGSDSGCEIHLDDQAKVAGRHACIFYSPKGKILLKDLGSEQGTFVGGKRVKRTVRLMPGQTVVLGTTEVFHSSWWNALQLSNITKITRMTMLTARRPVKPFAMTAPDTKNHTVTTLAFGWTLAALAVLGATLTLPRMNQAARHIERPRLVASEKAAPRRVKTEVEKPAEPEVNPNQHFVWDEIVNISRRFGDAPPSAMDAEFVAQVEEWIARMTKDGQQKIVMARKAKYWPEIEAALAAQRLPADLGYVVWVESRFDPHAVSQSGAVGLWQFVPATAREYGLRVDGLVDERLDPAKSSAAAARYFSALLRMFGSERYLLALASYNTGQNRVRRQEISADIRHARRTDFWHLRSSLPGETRDYVPKILAAIIIARNPDRW